MTKIPDNLIKLLIFAFLLSIFFIQNLNNLNENTLNYVNTELLESKFIEDEIYPYCDNIQYANSSKANLENLETLNINLVNKSSWYTNLFDTIEQDDVFIFEKNKKNFKAEVIAVFKHDVVCKFDAKIRLSGDFQDHIRSNDLATSLDVRLENGHIDNMSVNDYNVLEQLILQPEDLNSNDSDSRDENDFESTDEDYIPSNEEYVCDEILNIEY